MASESGRSRLNLAAHGLRGSERRPSIPAPAPRVVGDVLDATLRRGPERDALVGRHGRYSYAELDREVDRAVSVLAALGLGRGDRVAACLPNDADIVIAFLATMRIGALWVGVNRALAPPEKAYLLRDSGARVFLSPDDVASQLAGEDLPELDRVLQVEAGAAQSEWHERLARIANPQRRACAVEPHDPAAIAYTSGTTGFPKGAVHSHHNLILVGAVAAATGLYSPELRQGVVLPLTILNLVVLCPLVAFQVGSCCVAMDRIDPEGMAEWIREERVGHFAGVPTILHDLLSHPNVTADDLRSLVRPEVGGAECPEEFRKLYRERYGREVGIGYGMTEAPTAVARTDGTPSAFPGICGKALPQVRIEIRDEAGGLLPAGEIGEICVGPATEGEWAGLYTPMLGYWNKPDATREALEGGVYHTGDLGFLESDGTLYIRGRRNELILRGGANVYPAEVERVLGLHSAVAAAAVMGRPDPRLGERVVAAVVLEVGASVSEQALREHVAAELARYKVPDVVRIVGEFPRNAMGKVVKRELLAQFGD